MADRVDPGDQPAASDAPIAWPPPDAALALDELPKIDVVEPATGPLSTGTVGAPTSWAAPARAETLTRAASIVADAPAERAGADIVRPWPAPVARPPVEPVFASRQLEMTTEPTMARWPAPVGPTRLATAEVQATLTAWPAPDAPTRLATARAAGDEPVAALTGPVAAATDWPAPTTAATVAAPEALTTAHDVDTAAKPPIALAEDDAIRVAPLPALPDRPPATVDRAVDEPVKVTPWWRRRFGRVPAWGWVSAVVIGLVAIGVVASPDDGQPSSADPLPSTTTAGAAGSTPVASAEPTTGDGAAVDVTSPSTTTESSLVAQAPPVPDAAPATTTAASETEADPAATSTLVVTLPPTTTVAAPPPAAPSIEIEIRFNAEGDDRENPNGEWVRFVNAGQQAVDMTGWIVRDDGLVNAHVFEALVVGPGAAVTLYSGCGEASDTERYFCTSDGAVWNNNGDVVSLFGADGALIAQRRG